MLSSYHGCDDRTTGGAVDAHFGQPARMGRDGDGKGHQRRAGNCEHAAYGRTWPGHGPTTDPTSRREGWKESKIALPVPSPFCRATLTGPRFHEVAGTGTRGSAWQ